MCFSSDPRCFGPLGKFRHNIEISTKTARASRLSVSCDYGFRLKNCSEFTRKYLCWSLPFNKVTDWENSQNSLENTCSGILFLIKLQVGGTIPTSNYWHIYILFIAPLIIKPRLSTSFIQCAQNQTRQGSLLNVVKVYGFCSSI